MKDITEPTKIYIYAHPMLHRGIDYAHRTEWKFLLVEGIQHIEFYTFMSIDGSTSNLPMKW